MTATKIAALGMVAHCLGDALLDMDSMSEQITARDKEIERQRKENESLRLTADTLDKERTALQERLNASKPRKGKG
mgnify:CR=1 FL=1